MSRALVVLAQRGVEADAAARANLNATYRRFMAEADPERKNEAGKDLIRAVFGKDAIADKDFGSFMICGSGEFPKTVLAKGMAPFGARIE